jgi:hypothetical protein
LICSSNVAVVCTFSESDGLIGLRVGAWSALIGFTPFGGGDGKFVPESPEWHATNPRSS